MVIFKGTFTATSKKSNSPFYCVQLFEKREAQDKSVYFKDVQFFVDKAVYDKVNSAGLRFGDIVDVKTTAPMYIGGTEQLSEVICVKKSPYFDNPKN